MSATKLNKQLTLVYSADGVSAVINDSFNSPRPGVGLLSLDGYAAGTSSFYSEPISLGNANFYSVAFTCLSTGTPVGTVGIEVCDDTSRLNDGRPDANLVNWLPIFFTPASGGSAVSTQAVSGATKILFEELVCTYSWLRLVYTASSGSITVSAKAHLKGV